MSLFTERTGQESDRRVLHPSSDSDRQEVRDELERILASPSFKGSKRCSNLLRYVVEHALADSAEPLKELTLGVEVFGRRPFYNTDIDNTVRTAANDARKRLAQYYVGSGHKSRVRIDIPSGSYVPEFQSIAEVVDPAQEASHQGRRPRRVILLAAVLVLLLTAAAWMWLRPRPNAIDQFWGPVWGKDNSVLLVLRTRGWETPSAAVSGNESGTKSGTSGPASTLTEEAQLENISLSDAVALTRLGALLQAYGKQWRLRRPENTTLADLKGSPAVLFGSPANLWTGRLSDQLRFTAQYDAANRTYWIQDRLNPVRRDWKVESGGVPTLVYAIVSRLRESATGRIVVVLAGLTKYGTQTASEFVTNPAYLQAALSRLHGENGTKNIQFVIAAKLIDGTPGLPQLVAVHEW